MENYTNIFIRTASLDDAGTVLDIQREVVSESDFLITVDSEFNKTIVQQREWINKILENEKKQ